MFREVADALRAHDLFQDALRFYEPLQLLTNDGDSSYLTNMATCYEALGRHTKAIECYRTALVCDSTKADVQLQLAKLCQMLGIPNMIPIEPKKAVSADTSVWHQSKNKETTAIEQAGGSSTTQRSLFAMIAPRTSLRHIKQTATDRLLKGKAKDKDSNALYIRMQTLVEQVRKGESDSILKWMAIAKQLVEDFQSERVFFPYDKYMRFFGYTKEARRKSLNSKYESGARADFMTSDPQQMCSGKFPPK